MLRKIWQEMKKLSGELLDSDTTSSEVSKAKELSQGQHLHPLDQFEADRQKLWDYSQKVFRIFPYPDALTIYNRVKNPIIKHTLEDMFTEAERRIKEAIAEGDRAMKGHPSSSPYKSLAEVLSFPRDSYGYHFTGTLEKRILQYFAPHEIYVTWTLDKERTARGDSTTTQHDPLSFQVLEVITPENRNPNEMLTAWLRTSSIMQVVWDFLKAMHYSEKQRETMFDELWSQLIEPFEKFAKDKNAVSYASKEITIRREIESHIQAFQESVDNETDPPAWYGHVCQKKKCWEDEHATQMAVSFLEAHVTVYDRFLKPFAEVSLQRDFDARGPDGSTDWNRKYKLNEENVKKLSGYTSSNAHSWEIELYVRKKYASDPDVI